MFSLSSVVFFIFVFSNFCELRISVEAWIISLIEKILIIIQPTVLLEYIYYVHAK